MNLDPGTVATIGTIAGGFIAAAAAYFKSRENGGKLNEIHVLVNSNLEQIKKQLVTSLEHGAMLDVRLEKLAAANAVLETRLEEWAEAKAAHTDAEDKLIDLGERPHP